LIQARVFQDDFLPYPEDGCTEMNESGTIGPNASGGFEAERREMVERQIRSRGIRSVRVLAAMAEVPRHLFVPGERVHEAYMDAPVPIGEGQTISQPYIVALIAEALSLNGNERVLEVGAGSGYQAAVVSLLAREVVAVESQPKLVASARERLARLGYANVRIVEGDGSLGWPRCAPYDAILVTAAAPSVPEPLLEQMADAARLVIPVGSPEQQGLLRIVKTGTRAAQEFLCACRFVPLIGRYGWPSNAKETIHG
jgi:protein-L-isoaspartate(D-aspartate) O-methyltransferase